MSEINFIDKKYNCANMHFFHHKLIRFFCIKMTLKWMTWTKNKKSSQYKHRIDGNSLGKWQENISANCRQNVTSL